MIIRLVNRQKILQPDRKAIAAILRFLATKALPEISGRLELSLLLTDDAGSRNIKRQFFDLDQATDVISFSPVSPPAASRCGTAEIVINVERACQEGKKRGSIDREFALYLAHGCDHLAGHDDRTAKSRAKMRRRELRWLKEAERRRLLSGLLQAHRRAAQMQ